MKKIDSINGVFFRKDSRLKHWKPLITSWHESIELFCRLIKEDPPYWYTERANLSVFAGAAWRSGMVALEEFGHQKSEKKRGEADPKIWAGRCDLWLASKKEEELVEAKFKWISLRSKDFGGLARRVVEVAVGDARNSKQVRGARAVGLLFAPVYIPVKHEASMDVLIAEKIALAKELKADCVAWCFPGGTRHLKGSNKKNYCPGIFIFAKCS